MAFSANSRSLSNLADSTTSDQKPAGPHDLASNLGSASRAWGSSNIWGNGGLPSNGFSLGAAGREDVRSRHNMDGPPSSRPEADDGKKGSGSLVASSVSDRWSNGRAWSVSRSQQAKRADSSAQPSDLNGEHRSTASSARAQSSAGGNQNMNAFSSRASMSHSNITDRQSRPSLTTSFSNGFSARSSDQAPIVYTKFDRPIDPNARPTPDSATEGPWAFSPVDYNQKSSQMKNGKSPSIFDRRDSDVPPFRQKEQPPLSKNGFTFQGQSFSGHNPSVPSFSPHRGYDSRNRSPASSINADPDQLGLQFNKLSLQRGRRPTTSYPGSFFPGGADFEESAVLSGAPSYPHQSFNYHGPVTDGSDDLEATDRAGSPYVGLDGYSTSHQPVSNFMTTSLGARFGQNSLSAEYQQPHSNKPGANRQHGLSHDARAPSDWQATARRTPNAQDQVAYMDPRMQHMLAAQFGAPYAPVYNPYAMPTLHAPSPYMQFVPMGLPPVDPRNSGREPAAGDGVQSALLYNFKSNTKSKRYELQDIYDHIAEFSGDQHGSRFIQTKLETANSDEKDRVFREIEPNAIPLMTDVFGNYVIQKFFEHGDQTHKKILANKMRGQVLSLSLQMYGCRVVQKALDHILVDQQALVVSELEGHVLKCVKDQNGNHVIQKAIERCPSHTIGFIINAFHGQVQHLSIHPYGCRVIQRCLERCDPPSKAMIMAELMDGIQGMVSDQYGNYVVQHIVEHDNGEGKHRVLAIVGRGLESYSKHKFASNVVEKCLVKADDNWRRQVVIALANGGQRRGDGEGMVTSMVKDSFGNYVIQKLLETLAPEDYLTFLDLLHPAIALAKRTGCGKQLLSVEKKMHRFPAYRPAPHSPPRHQLPLQHPRPHALPHHQQNHSHQHSHHQPLQPHLYYPPELPQPHHTHNHAQNPTLHHLMDPPHSLPGTTFGSAATTPPLPPLTADTQSLQSSAIPSVNGDAVEGVVGASRKGSDISSGEGAGQGEWGR